MKASKFLLHRDLAGFEASKRDEKLVNPLATLGFTNTAQNVVSVGRPGTGKTHLTKAIGVCVIAVMANGYGTTQRLI